MYHILFGSPDLVNLETAILIKNTGLNRTKLETNYINPIKEAPGKFIAFSLEYETAKKVSAKYAKNFLRELLPEINRLNIKTLLVCDGTYFKFLTGLRKADPYYGELCACTIKGFEHLTIILAPNYQALNYNPMIQGKMDRALTALSGHMSGSFIIPGSKIIKSESYPKTEQEIKDAFAYLHTLPALTCDLEALSLEFWNAGISTVAFAWNQHEGIAFAFDRAEHPEAKTPIEQIADLTIGRKTLYRRYLKDFLETYRGTLIFHNAGYDMKVLVYELWMQDLGDYKGMLDGIHTLTRNFEDTKLIAYLATNNAVENVLGLKELSAEFTGNYAEDVSDTSKIPLNELLQYNLIDCLATWYVHDKYLPIMIQDQQQDLYENLIKPSVKSLLQMELCGMPINPDKVASAKDKLTALVKGHQDALNQSNLVKEYHYQLLEEKAAKLTAKAKKKVYTVSDSTVLKDLENFNLNSGPQKQGLLYDFLGLPVLDRTDTKLPATGGKTLKALLNHTKDPEIIEIIENLIGFTKADKILSTFIVAFENAQQLPDGSWRLYGNFNQGGTQSLRLSSSNPNLQNLPSGSDFAKIIKECFEPIKGWVFGGSDFDAIESKTNALLTRDEHQLAVYTDGFDGHCLRAFFYFKDEMPDIAAELQGYFDDSSQKVNKKKITKAEAVKIINSIKQRYPEQRQRSKAPSFALQYGGTFHTLMKNCGFSETKAKTIETAYHELYKVADQWIADLVEKAKTCGYIPMAFGGRIRTPLLVRSKGKSRMPYLAQKEARSAGNAATQSYCVLTLRALNEFMQRVWASPYRYDILPAGTIHDAVYLVWRESAVITEWVNTNLIGCMAWQDLPELQHPTIKMSSELDIYWPNWANAITLPNHSTIQEIKGICKSGAKEYRDNLKQKKAA